jgi:hypothetical protein
VGQNCSKDRNTNNNKDVKPDKKGRVCVSISYRVGVGAKTSEK